MCRVHIVAVIWKYVLITSVFLFSKMHNLKWNNIKMDDLLYEIKWRKKYWSTTVASYVNVLLYDIIWMSQWTKKHTFHGDIIGNNVWLLLFIYLVYLCIFSRVPKCCRFTFCVCMVYFQYCEQYTIIITLSLLLLLLILLFFSLFLLSAWKHVQNDLWVLTDNDNII